MKRLWQFLFMVLFSTFFTSEAMHPRPRQYSINFFDEELPVSQGALEQFDVYKTERRFQAKSKTEIKGIKQSVFGITNWNIDNYLSLFLDAKNLFFKEFSKKRIFAKKTWKKSKDFLGMTSEDVDDVKKVVRNLIGIADGDEDVSNIKDEDLLFKLVILADLLKNYYVMRACAKQLMLLSMAHEKALLCGERKADSPLMSAAFSSNAKGVEFVTESGDFYHCDLQEHCGLQKESCKSWNFLDGNKLAILGMQLDYDRKRVFVFGHDFLQLWDMQKKQKVRDFGEGAERIHNIAVSPDGKTMISYKRFDDPLVWDVQTGKQLEGFKNYDIMETNKVVFHPDGDRVFILRGHKQISVFSLKKRDFLSCFQMKKDDLEGDLDLQRFIIDFGLSKDGKSMFFLQEGRVIYVWDIAEQEEVKFLRKKKLLFDEEFFSPLRLVVHPDGDNLILFSPLRSNFFLACSTSPNDPFVVLWRKSKEPIRDVVFSPIGDALIAFSSFNRYSIWTWISDWQGYKNLTYNQIALWFKAEKRKKNEMSVVKIVKGSDEYDTFKGLPSFLKKRMIQKGMVKILKKK